VPTEAGPARDAEPPPESAAPLGGVTFTEVAAEAGLDYAQAPVATQIGCDQPSARPCVFTAVHMSGGAAAGDVDGDGWIDLYVTRLDAPGILFRNMGGRLEDQSERFGLTAAGRGGNGAGFADLDNDGDQDLYVTNLLERRFQLFVNEDGRFVEDAVARGAAVETGHRHHGFGVAFGDYDRDGFLDLHTTEWVQLDAEDGVPNHARLLRNRGAEAPGFFEDVTSAAGVDLLEGLRPTRTSFTSTFSDLDQDGWPDLIVTADFNSSHLFWNEGNGTFIDGTNYSRVGTDLNGMGSALGDYDGDGDLDWFVTAIYDPDYRCDGVSCGWGTDGNRLYQNQGDRTFADRTDVAGVRDGGWGWGAAFFDPDNDGDLDIAMTNGVDFPNPEAERFRSDTTRLFRNDGDGTFTDVAAAAGVDDRGDGRGLLVFDYDDDGDEDLFVVQHEGAPRLYRNDGGNAQSFLRVRLRGTLGNRDGVGARLLLRRTAREAPRLRELRGGNDFLGQSESVIHFGLGDHEGPVFELRVVWPSGQVQVVRDVPVRTTLTLDEAG
jgi:enediyne biosynthesis protein E4